MSRRPKIAVRLHPGADGTAADTREQARHAERLGLDGIFVGDHLKPAGPYPESMVVLAAAAGVTERIHLGVGVMVLDPRMSTAISPDRDAASALCRQAAGSAQPERPVH
jgi:alkanesulfonate monooxygenase SsuD/methylene tetrahydromethanopterin reductase-like flavin-dependent oxidoreductase (luciferase family)